jgi:DNA-binding LacI/PurR family transcriptional regulator
MAGSGTGSEQGPEQGTGSEQGPQHGPQPVRRVPVLADVAKRAGVSSQTVSRVLRDEPWVSDQTRARVMAAVRELAYHPNRAARTLVTRRSWTLGVLGLDVTVFGAVSPLIGFEREARLSGYGVSVSTVTSFTDRAVTAAVEGLLELHVDGLLVVALEAQAATSLHRLPHSLPTVAVEAGPDSGFDTVGLDQVAAARVAVQHLIDLGHRSIGHITGPSQRLEAQGRRTGWQTALADAGLHEGPCWDGDWTPQSGYAAGEAFSRSRDCTAVFAANDMMALGFMSAVQQAGLRVPADVSVVGFDDLPESAYLLPPLTTIRQDLDEVGKACVALLLHRISAPGEAPRRTVVPTQLVVRQSTTVP